jgi:hypothetical protein
VNRWAVPAEAVFAAGSLTAWKAAFDDATPWWMVDFGRSLRFGGLVIQWPENLPPRAFVIEASDDGATWTKFIVRSQPKVLKSHIPTSGAEARQLRILFANSACAALNSLTIRPDAYSRTQNQFIHNVAADFPRGWLPRYWLREQSTGRLSAVPTGNAAR